MADGDGTVHKALMREMAEPSSRRLFERPTTSAAGVIVGGTASGAQSPNGRRRWRHQRCCCGGGTRNSPAHSLYVPVRWTPAGSLRAETARGAGTVQLRPLCERHGNGSDSHRRGDRDRDEEPARQRRGSQARGLVKTGSVRFQPSTTTPRPSTHTGPRGTRRRVDVGVALRVPLIRGRRLFFGVLAKELPCNALGVFFSFFDRYFARQIPRQPSVRTVCPPLEPLGPCQPPIERRLLRSEHRRSWSRYATQVAP